MVDPASEAQPQYQSQSRSGDAPLKVLLAVVVVSFIVAIIGVVIAGVNISKTQPETTATSSPTQSESQTEEDTSMENDKPKEKIYLVAVGNDWGAYEYIDDEGYLSGFSGEFIEAICSAAGINCKVVWDPYYNCWETHPGLHNRAGPGILGGWYDACTGWVPNMERLHVLRFSQSYLNPPGAAFFLKKGTTFNPLNVTGIRFGFFDGWVYNEKCLLRAGVAGTPLPETHYRYFNLPEDIGKALLDGTIDAGMGPDDIFHEEINNNLLERVTIDNICLIGGNAMMTLKTNDFNDYFNYGLSKIMSNGVYRTLCIESRARHNRGPINCINV